MAIVSFASNHTIMLSLLLVLVVSLSAPFIITTPKPKETPYSPSKPNEMAATTTTEIFGVTIEKNLPESKLAELAVSSWPTWSGPPSKFPWTFEDTETMYFREGKVKVNVDGFEGSFEIGAGDFVVFPKGMKVTWDVIEAVKKHYSLEKEK